jgi:hemerythrin superfamily protein
MAELDLDSALTGKPAEGAGATEILRADHAEVMRLFSEYEGAKGSARHTQRVLAQSICVQLELHDTLEREIFYPALRELDSERIGAALREHDEMLGAVAALKAQADAAASTDEPLERLKRLVESHVAEEEEALFPRAERELAAAMQDLGKRLIQRKQELTGSAESLEGPAT